MANDIKNQDNGNHQLNSIRNDFNEKVVGFLFEIKMLMHVRLLISWKDFRWKSS